MPEGTAPLSSGNLKTCDAQGYLALGLSIACPMCNASLSIYYNLIIKYGWSDSKINKIEKYLHIIPSSVGFTVAIVPLVAKLYVPGIWACWIGNTQYPLGCNSSSTCVRGWNAQYYFWPIFFLLWLAPLYVAWSMYLVYKHVRGTEKRLQRYDSVANLQTDEERRAQEKKNAKKSRKVMEQSVLYSLAMFVVLFWGAIAIILLQFNVPVPLWVITLFTLTNPAQGCFNLLIHLRRTGKVPNINESIPSKKFTSSRFAVSVRTLWNSSKNRQSTDDMEEKEEEDQDER